jgi:uncharacterized membrane protein YozB (DUF420 family)
MADYTSFLPHVNAFLNTTSAILLIIGYKLIRRGHIEAHKRCQLSALATSIAFLASYLTYHYFHGTTRFTGQGIIRPVYFAILTSHTILAVIIVPLVAVTLWRALHTDFARHRKIARITLPLWLYVSVTGVLVYVILYQLFPSR